MAGSPRRRAVNVGGVPIGGKIIRIYNDRDQQTESQIRDAEDRVVSRVVRSYDANGRMIEEKQIQENPALLIAEMARANGEPQPTAEALEAINRDQFLSLEHEIRFTYEYEYDSHGNWTQQTVSGDETDPHLPAQAYVLLNCTNRDNHVAAVQFLQYSRPVRCPKTLPLCLPQLIDFMEAPIKNFLCPESDESVEKIGHGGR